MEKRDFFLLLSALLLAGATLSMGVVNALAQGSELYVVRDIDVDVSDISAVEARRKALQEAQLLGFHRLSRRATLREDWARLPRVTFDEIRSMILSLEIESEKSSTTRYLANVTVSFDSAAFESLLSGANIAFLEFSPLSSLVLPLYFDSGGWVLWQEPNPWWNAWSDLNANLLAVSYLLPLGDLEDRLTLPILRLVKGEDKLLAQIAVRYGVDEILLTRAVPDAERAGEAQISALVYRLLPASGEVTKLRSFDFRATNLKQAAANIADHIEQDWKHRNIREWDKPATFRLRASFNDIREWSRMQRSLESASYLNLLQVEAIDIRGAWLRLGFNGNEEMLLDGLRHNGFLVIKESDESGPDVHGVWTLHLAANPPEQNAIP